MRSEIILDGIVQARIRGASLDGITDELRAFHEGLKEAGFVEGDKSSVKNPVFRLGTGEGWR